MIFPMKSKACWYTNTMKGSHSNFTDSRLVFINVWRMLETNTAAVLQGEAAFRPFPVIFLRSMFQDWQSEALESLKKS